MCYMAQLCGGGGTCVQAWTWHVLPTCAGKASLYPYGLVCSCHTCSRPASLHTSILHSNASSVARRSQAVPFYQGVLHGPSLRASAEEHVQEGGQAGRHLALGEACGGGGGGGTRGGRTDMHQTGPI
jgi:hypothetical protein